MMHINRDLLLAVLIVLMVGAVALVTSTFVSPNNLIGLVNDTAILVMMALAQMTVILTKCIDLSVAANIAFTGVVVALVNASYPDIPIPAIMLLAVLVGLALGAFNGALVWLVGIPSIVVTLGTLSIYRGLAFVTSGGTSIVGHKMSADFIGVPRVRLLEVPAMTWFAVAVVIGLALVLRLTRIGRAF
jgi:rhamnose transport system permease protein